MMEGLNAPAGALSGILTRLAGSSSEYNSNSNRIHSNSNDNRNREYIQSGSSHQQQSGRTNAASTLKSKSPSLRGGASGRLSSPGPTFASSGGSSASQGNSFVAPRRARSMGKSALSECDLFLRRWNLGKQGIHDVWETCKNLIRRRVQVFPAREGDAVMYAGFALLRTLIETQFEEVLSDTPLRKSIVQYVSGGLRDEVESADEIMLADRLKILAYVTRGGSMLQGIEEEIKSVIVAWFAAPEEPTWRALLSKTSSSHQNMLEDHVAFFLNHAKRAVPRFRMHEEDQDGDEATRRLRKELRTRLAFLRFAGSALSRSRKSFDAATLRAVLEKLCNECTTLHAVRTYSMRASKISQGGSSLSQRPSSRQSEQQARGRPGHAKHKSADLGTRHAGLEAQRSRLIRAKTASSPSHSAEEAPISQLHSGSAAAMKACLDMFFSFAHFDLIPSTSLPKCITTFCRLVNLESRRAWDIMRTVLGKSDARRASSARSHEKGGALRVQAFGALLMLMNDENEVGSSGDGMPIDAETIRSAPVSPGSLWLPSMTAANDAVPESKLSRARANVLRGAVFFVSMSLWGSQRVEGLLSQYSFAEVLHFIRKVVMCNEPLVSGEVLLSLHRLVVKYGKNLTIVEWDFLIDILLRLTRFVFCSAGAWSASEDRGVGQSSGPGIDIPRSVQVYSPEQGDMYASSRDGRSDSFQAMKLRRYSTQMASRASMTISSPPPADSIKLDELKMYVGVLVDILKAIGALEASGSFSGSPEHLFVLVHALAMEKDTIPEIPEKLIVRLLEHMSYYTHPATPNWVSILERVMRMFYTNMHLVHVREEALTILHRTLWAARHTGYDEVIEKVMLPALGDVHKEPDAALRKRGIDLVVETARYVHTDRFDKLLTILVAAVVSSPHEDSIVLAASGISSILSSSFEYPPPSRLLRLIDVLVKQMLPHPMSEVRRVSVACLMRLRANSRYQLQWRDESSERTRVSELVSCCSSKHANARIGAVLRVSSLVTSVLAQMEREDESDVLNSLLDTILGYVLNNFFLHEVEIAPIVQWYCDMLRKESSGHFAVSKVIVSHLDALGQGVASPTSPSDSTRSFSRSSASKTPPVLIKSFLPGVRFGIGRGIALSAAQQAVQETAGSETASAMSVTAKSRKINFGCKLASKIDYSAACDDKMALLRHSRFVVKALRTLRLFAGYSAAGSEATSESSMFLCLANAIPVPFQQLDFVQRTLPFDASGCDAIVAAEAQGTLEALSCVCIEALQALSVYCKAFESSGRIQLSLLLRRIRETLRLEFLSGSSTSYRRNVSTTGYLHRRWVGMIMPPVLEFLCDVGNTAVLRAKASAKGFLKSIVAPHDAEAILSMIVPFLDPACSIPNAKRTMALATRCFVTFFLQCTFRERVSYGPMISSKLREILSSRLAFSPAPFSVSPAASPARVDEPRGTPDSVNYDGRRNGMRGQLHQGGAAAYSPSLYCFASSLLQIIGRHLYDATLHEDMEFAAKHSNLPHTMPLMPSVLNDRPVWKSQSWSSETGILTVSTVPNRNVALATVRSATGVQRWGVRLHNGRVTKVEAVDSPELVFFTVTSTFMPNNIFVRMSSKRRSKSASLKSREIAWAPDTVGGDDNVSAGHDAGHKRAAVGSFYSVVSSIGSDAPGPFRERLNSTGTFLSKVGSSVDSSRGFVGKALRGASHVSDDDIDDDDASHVSSGAASFPSAFSPVIGPSSSQISESILLDGVESPFADLDDKALSNAATSSERISRGAATSARMRMKASSLSPIKTARLRSNSEHTPQSPSPRSPKIKVLVHTDPAGAKASKWRKPAGDTVASSRDLFGSISEAIGASRAQQLSFRPLDADLKEPPKLHRSVDNINAALRDVAEAGDGEHPTITSAVSDGEADEEIPFAELIMLQLHGITGGGFDFHFTGPHGSANLSTHGNAKLAHSEKLERALTVLDRIPTFEAYKAGIVYVRNGQSDEHEIFGNVHGSPEYNAFLERLGDVIPLQECKARGYFTAGLDCINGSDGEYSLLWRQPYLQIHYHVATLMPSTGIAGQCMQSSIGRHVQSPNSDVESVNTDDEMSVTRTRLFGHVEDETQRDAGKDDLAARTSALNLESNSSGVISLEHFKNKKRHIGNDFVTIAFVDAAQDSHLCTDGTEGLFSETTITGQFNWVHIVVKPMGGEENSHFKVDVRRKSHVPSFGPLCGSQVVPAIAVGPLIRNTIVNANILCRMLCDIEHLSNWEERYVQIERVKQRFS